MTRNYYDPVYTKWRKDVKKRDGYICQMPRCGYKKSLQVHHIEKWSAQPHLRYELSNGITLCPWCHKLVNRCEEHYVGLFMEIVRSRND